MEPLEVVVIDEVRRYLARQRGRLAVLHSNRFRGEFQRRWGLRSHRQFGFIWVIIQSYPVITDSRGRTWRLDGVDRRCGRTVLFYALAGDGSA